MVRFAKANTLAQQPNRQYPEIPLALAFSWHTPGASLQPVLRTSGSQLNRVHATSSLIPGFIAEMRNIPPAPRKHWFPASREQPKSSSEFLEKPGGSVGSP